MDRIKIYCLLLIIGLLSNSLCAQESQYFKKGFTVEKDLYSKFDNYSTQDGLVCDDVKLILQDHIGYIWFGTSQGLSKFDGYEFTNYQYKSNDSSSLSNNFITAIEEDINGDLWIGTRNGLNKLNRAQGTFQRFFSDNGKPHSLQDNYITDVLSDSSGLIWIDTYKGYLHKYNLKDSTVVYFKHQAAKNDTYYINKLYKDGNKIWIFYMNKTQIFSIDEERFDLFEDRNMKMIDTDHKSWFSNFTSTIKDDFGNYYFGSIHSKSFIYNPTIQSLKGLPFGSIYSIIKTKNEKILLGGYSIGLLEYNIAKNSFIHYVKSDDNLSSIPSNRVWDILEDDNGNIWMATPSGVSKLSPQKHKFQHIRHISNYKESIISNDVKDVIQTKDSNIWIATMSGISILNKNKKSIKVHQYDSNEKGSLLSNKVKCLYQDKEETVWVGGWSGLGLDFIKKGNERFEHYSISKRSNGHDWYVDFAEGNDDFFVGVWGSVAFSKFDRNKLKMFESYRGFCLGSNHNSSLIQVFNDKLFVKSFGYYGLSDSEYKSFYSKNTKGAYLSSRSKYYSKKIDLEDSERTTGYKIIEDKLYIYTNFNLWRYDEPQDTLIRVFRESKEINAIAKSNEKDCIWIGNENKLIKVNLLNANKSLIEIISPSEITDIFSDSNTIYVGTSKGLFYVKETSLSTFIDFKNVKELEGVKINEVLKIKGGDFCVSSDQGLYVLNSQLKITKHFTTENSNLSNPIIYDLFLDKNQDLWIATQAGLNLYNQNNNDFQSWISDEMNPNSLLENEILSITEKDDNIFLGSKKGYTIFNRVSNTFIRMNSAGENSIQTSLTTCLLADYKENIWIGNGSGGNSVDYLNTKTNKIKHYHDLPYDSTSFKGDYVYFVFEDSKKIIWIGTNKGLNKFNSLNKSFTLYSVSDGMPAAVLFAMEEDSKGNYWISTNIGIIKFNKDSLTFDHFTLNDGLSSNAFSQKASTKLYSGELVFGSDKGLTIFHPDSIYPSTKLPNLALSKLYIFDSLAYDDLSELHEIQLNHNENNFTIEFTVLDYINPDKNSFSYRLKGYDKEWIDAGFENRKAKYTTLPYGNYTFQLIAANHDGLWTKNPIEIKILIKPPWYRTLVAYAGYFLLFILFSFLYGNFRIRRIKKKNRELEETIIQRTQEIREKTEEMNAQNISEILKESKLDIAKERISGQEEERRRISRELHDGIGGHLTGIKLFLENLLDENENSEIRLLYEDVDRLYNEVRHLSHDLLPPEFEETSVKEVLKLYIEQYILRSDFDINISFHPRTQWDKVDQLVQIDIYRIVQELLQNAIKHSNASEIELEIVRHQEYIAIMVEDNGKGMQNNDELSGSGLKGLKSRLELVNGKIFFDSQLGRGTIVNVELPFVFQIDTEQKTNPLNI